MSTNEISHLLEIGADESDWATLLGGDLLDAIGEYTPVDSWRYRWAKRALDICASIVLIILVSIPGALVAAIIWIQRPAAQSR